MLASTTALLLYKFVRRYQLMGNSILTVNKHMKPPDVVLETATRGVKTLKGVPYNIVLCTDCLIALQMMLGSVSYKKLDDMKCYTGISIR